MAEAPDRPGVVALPPLIYLVELIVAIAADRLFPVTLAVPVTVRWLGGALIVAGVVFGGSARTAFSRAGTNVNPMQPATKLVTSGAFRFSRNPMYVGMAVAFAGLALATRIGWLLILLAPVLAIMHWGVVLREEPYLVRKFGAEYEAYRARVRRYL